MKKTPFVTLEKVQEIAEKYPTPFHLYDEKGIRENAQALKEAFAWNKGFKEFFAVKATPNPFLIKILQEYGCGCDCSSMTELMLSKAIGCKKGDIMFSSNDTPDKEFKYADEIGNMDEIRAYQEQAASLNMQMRSVELSILMTSLILRV